jgi:ribosomal protein S18 acetylase RimI-like enzyme
MRTEVTTWYVEMLSADQLRPLPCPMARARVERAEIPSPELSRFLYTAVGGHWYWLGRLDWDYARWLAWVDRPALETLVLSVCGTPAGYVELETQADDQVEITCFGLLPGFIGQRLGGYLLSEGVRHAWEQGASRVWLHTCSFDGPKALTNYRARGFRVYDETREWLDVPDATPGPWPNAAYPGPLPGPSLE